MDIYLEKANAIVAERKRNATLARAREKDASPSVKNKAKTKPKHKP